VVGLVNPRYFKMGVKSIRERSIRSWLTIFGIIISIAVILTLFSLSNGVSNAVNDLFNELGRNRIFITQDFRSIGNGQDPLLRKDVEAIESLPYFKMVIPMLMRNAQKVEFKGEERYLIVAGIPNLNVRAIIKEYKYDENLISGRFFSEGERGVAVLGYKIANDRDIFSRRINVRNSIYIDGKKFRVVGIYKELGTTDDNTITIPLDDAREIFNATESVTMADAVVKDGINIDDAKAKVIRLMEKRKGKNAVTVMTPEAIIKQFNNIMGIVGGILIGIAAISLLVGAVGIANNMFTSVLEREREIGIMKSVGAKNSDIMQIFVIESGLIGFFGGLAGVVLGIILSVIVEKIAAGMGYSLLKIIISPFDVIFVLLFAFSVGIISGIVPAWSASRKKIIDTLRN